ncbi:MAG: T9SS type A sorting domain-containing protein, partial [Candidatus Marinimicrobia bacterium]|nr:T9SS type A sorting domain-containing protein [Candidatus Neomarinimicrobiota bacterium]
LWGNSNWNYAQASMGYVSESDFRWGYYGSRGWDEANLVTYMESHDEERLMYKNLQWGNHSGDYDIRNLAIALNRIKLAAGFFFTLPGPKMIWQFEELGYDVSIDDPCRICEKPIRWNYFEDWRRKSVYKTFQALIKLRKENDVFKSPETIVDLSVSREWKRIRLSHPSMKVVIIGNFNVMNRSINPIFYNTGKWYEYFTGDSIEVTNVNDQFVLKPGELRIYTTSKLETPEQGILSDIEPYFENIPERFYLSNNYPNPFNSFTTFEYELDFTSNVEIKIFDLLGREIFITNQGYQNSGLYRFSWDGKDSNGLDVNSGIYFAVLKKNGDIKIKKMTLLK